MKTKGALIWEFNQPWSIEEIEIGDPVKDEVKIQMEASGMCHSDHHLVTGDIPMAGFPVLGGHEGAGIVTEVGPGVENIAPGDHVVLSFIPSCGECPTCQAGMRNLCDLGCPSARRHGRLRRHLPGHSADGKPVYPDDAAGHLQPVHGGAQELGREDRPVHPVRGGLPRRLRCDHRLRLGDAQRRHPPGTDVAIVGVGGVGMGALQGAVNAGARNIFAIDPVEWKRDQALKFGATHVYPDIVCRDDAASPRSPRAGWPSKIDHHRRRAQRRGHRQLPQLHRPRAAPAW